MCVYVCVCVCVTKLYIILIMIIYLSSLQAMYDYDVIEEEVLLDWGKKVSKKYVSKETAAEIHAKAQPFLKWLQEAEEEETTEEEEEEDVGVEVSGGGARC